MTYVVIKGLWGLGPVYNHEASGRVLSEEWDHAKQ